MHFFFRVVGAEIGFQPLQRLQQGKVTEFIERHGFSCQHLKRQFMRGHTFAQRAFAANHQQASQRWHPLAGWIACAESQRSIQRFIVQFEQKAVAAVLAYGLAQALALQRIKVSQRATCHRLGGHIDQTKA